MEDHVVSGTSKNPQGKHIGKGQRQMAYNVYSKHRNDNPHLSKTAAVLQTAEEIGISKNTMFDIIKNMGSKNLKSPSKKRKYQSLYSTLSEAQIGAVRRHVHSFFLRNELPTCSKILQVNKLNHNIFVILNKMFFSCRLLVMIPVYLL